MLIHGFLLVNARLLKAFGTTFYAIMEIFVRNATSKTVKWYRALVKVNVCLLTSRPIPKRNLHIGAVGRGLRMYVKTQNGKM